VERILSDEEVDALLQAAQDVQMKSDGDAPAALQAGEAMPYDLVHQGQPVRGPLPSLDRIDDRFSRSIRASLMGVLRRRIEGSLRGRAFVKAGEWIASLPSPSCLALFRAEGLKENGILVLDAPLVYAVLDAFFGSKEVHDDDVELRELTAIEQRIVARVSRVLLEEMARAWAPLCALRPELTRIETNPQFVTHFPSHAVVVETRYALDIDGRQAGIRTIIPYDALEPLKDKLSSGAREPGGRDAMLEEHLWSRVQSTEVRVDAELGRGQLRVRDLLALAPGEVLTLEGGGHGQASLRVEGTVKALGRPVVVHGSYALRIEQLLAARGGRP
jgi:flagellar motor switch protein FliM